MAKHAKLSPSSAERWMNCPGSVALIGDDNQMAGPAAFIGTGGHKVIEVMGDNKETDASKYLGWTAFVHMKGVEETRLAKVKKPTPMEGWFVVPIDEKLVNGCQIFVDEVERLKLEMYEPEEIGERFLDMSWLDDRLGGTADKTLVEPFGWAHLLDYKNGYKIVEVDDNDQFKNYAVGILHEHPDAEGVHCTVVQPNAPHDEGVIRTKSYTREELKIYEVQLKEAADATSKPNAKLRAGNWCTYCVAKTRCPAFDEKMAAEAGADFADDPVPLQADLSTPDEVAYLCDLGRKAKWIPMLDQWAREVEGAIQTALINGKTVPGQKLVESKPHRKWLVDGIELERRVAGELSGTAFKAISQQMWLEPKLKSPAQVEKLGDKETKKQMKALVAELAASPPGKLTVASENDPRPAVSAADMAMNDFADDPVEDENA